MGDNLKAAARFVRTSKNSIDSLLHSDLSQVDMMTELASVQSQAKSMRARAIYRATQTVVDLLDSETPRQNIGAELGVVQGLLTQYETGLLEITEQAHAPAPISAPTLAVVATSEAQDDLDEKFQTARETLESVIDFAPSAEKRDALRRLSSINDFSPSVEETEKNSPAIEEPKPAVQAPVEFESLMPAFSNFVLTTARHLGKTVSLSYQGNDISIARDVSGQIDLALRELGVLLVGYSVQDPETRRANGQSGAGHISLIATNTKGQLALKFECTGRAIPEARLDIDSLQALKNLGASIKQTQNADRMILEIGPINQKSATSAPKSEAPVIESPTSEFDALAEMDLLQEQAG